MSGPLAALALVLAGVLSAALVWPAARRTRLGLWHPAVCWLALEAVFFGVGSIVLAVSDGRPGPALYVAAAVGAFALGVAVSDRLAHRVGEAVPPSVSRAGSGDGYRAGVAIALVLLSSALVVPTLLRVGLPILAGDITGARSEISGPMVQPVRVFLAAFAVALAVRAWRRPGDRRTLVAAIVVGVVLLVELALASRYLPAELLAALLVAAGLAGRRLPLVRLGIVAAVLVVLFAGVQVLRAYDQAAGRELEFAAQRTVSRIVMIQPRTLDALQAAIPAERPFFAGATWLREFGGLIGRADIPNLGYWIYPRLFPDQASAGYAAPGLLGEAWANFGPAGIGLFGAFGVLVERLGALIARRRALTADLVAGAMLVLFVARTHALGVNGLAVLVALTAAWRLAAGDDVGGLLRDLRRVIAWR